MTNNFQKMIESSGGMIEIKNNIHKIAWCLPDISSGLEKAGYITFVPEELEIISKNKDITSNTVELINSVKSIFGGTIIDE